MTRRISMSKAKRLTESLKSKNRRFQESSRSVSDWFSHEWMENDVGIRKMSWLFGLYDEKDFKGLTQALKETFKPDDKVNYLFGSGKDLIDLLDLLKREDKKPKVFQDTYVFQADNGNYKDHNVVYSADEYGNVAVVVAH